VTNANSACVSTGSSSAGGKTARQAPPEAPAKERRPLPLVTLFQKQVNLRLLRYVELDKDYSVRGVQLWMQNVY